MSNPKSEKQKQRVHEFVQKGRFIDAKILLEKLCKKFPKDFDVWHLLGAVYGQLNNIESSIKCSEKALALKPNSAEAHYNYAMALTRLGRYEDAINAYSRSIAIRPEAAASHHNLGNLLKNRGKFEEALTHYRRALELDPSRAEALFSMGIVFMDIGQHEDAIHYLQKCMTIDPRLESKAGYFIAGLTGDSSNKDIAAQHVKDIHDIHASYFDVHLTQGLGYEVPSLLFTAYQEECGVSNQELTVLDLGCGTGLCGKAFHSIASSITGIDLSPNMVEQARLTGVYDILITAELEQYLAANDKKYDLILAADVFIYVGEIGDVLEYCASALNDRGCLAFSVEGLEGDGYILRSSGRFAHSVKYLQNVIDAAGLRLLATRPVVIRKEFENNIYGSVIIAQKSK